MRKVFLAVALVLFPALSAMAASNSRFELFGGYSYLHTSFDSNAMGVSGVTSNNLNGWDSSVTANLNRWIGLVADFGGSYGKQFQTTDGNASRPYAYSFLFGPRFYVSKSDRLRPFAESLFGTVHAREGINALDSTKSAQINTAFAAALGGGLDVRLKKHIELRAIEADYVVSRLFNTNQNSARISTGIIFRIGHIE